MTLKECYQKMGGNYDEVFSRFRKEERVQKFVLKFLNDKSYELLCESYACFPHNKRYLSKFKFYKTLSILLSIN